MATVKNDDIQKIIDEYGGDKKIMTKYQAGKEAARAAAQEWQNDFARHMYCWSELATISEYFEKLGRRYGLLTEFRENSII